MPRLSDDGRTVTLDLHGARLHDAERLIRRVAALASEHGRHQIKVIHGASTSSAVYRNDTIRHTLYDLLDDGALDAWVTDYVRFEGHALLSLPLTGRPDTRRITMRDLGS